MKPAPGLPLCEKASNLFRVFLQDAELGAGSVADVAALAQFESTWPIACASAERLWWHAVQAAVVAGSVSASPFGFLTALRPMGKTASDRSRGTWRSWWCRPGVR